MAREIPVIEIEIPPELLDGCEVHKDGKFLGWFNAKEKCIKKITVTKIYYK